MPQTLTDMNPAEPDTAEPDTDEGVVTIPGAQLRIGDVVDYPHGPEAITAMWSPKYLTSALGPGSAAIKHSTRPSRIIAGDQDVQVLLPRPREAA